MPLAQGPLPTLPLLTAHCSLLTAHCSLLTAHCSLPSFRFQLSAFRFPLFTSSSPSAMRLPSILSRPSLLALLALVLSSAGCRKKVDPQTAGQQFFDLVTSGHADQAYNSSSFAFQAQQSEKA